MDFLHAIRQGKKAGLTFNKIARKIYLTYPTHAFMGEEERQYIIFDEISEFLKVPISCIQVAGSAKTGHSFHKGSIFMRGVSDLDIAIIDSALFTKYMEIACEISRNYKNPAKFPVSKGRSVMETYLSYLSRGILRPDLMPTGNEKAEVTDFFGRLSARHSDLFSSINSAIYLSQAFFEVKQRSSISNFLDGQVY